MSRPDRMLLPTARRRIGMRGAECRDRHGNPVRDAADQGRELGRARTDCRLVKDPFDRPIGVAPMRARHVLGHGRMVAPPAAAQVHGDTFTFAEQLDGVSGDASCSRISQRGTDTMRKFRYVFHEITGSRPHLNLCLILGSGSDRIPLGTDKSFFHLGHARSQVGDRCRD